MPHWPWRRRATSWPGRPARSSLAAKDERWRAVVELLAEWTKRSREADAAKPRRTEINAALAWIKKVTTEIRDARVDAFAGHMQRIWEKLRRQSSVDLKNVLPHAFRRQGMPVTVLKVERGERSKVHVTTETDPVQEAIDDATALAQTKECPAEALRNVLPALCREALAKAIVEAAWIRRSRTGLSVDRLQAAIDETDRLIPLASFALFDDGEVHPDEEVRSRLRTLYGPESTTLIRQCQRGAHPDGFLPADAVAFVRKVENLAHRIRKPEVNA
ncbi:hypothetical protein GCM10009601_04170 [Streptomyces thermospinosisporus]|uniref:Uncharacterized protein n=1 Tax=Streptomyces thermospinosisporus TaxID=161482 RepID=A0ABP4JAV8_9ACTN